ncbi:NUDIX domain-containing protein [Paenibacillus sp. D2_2]|uniref:NUDIX hydrolase n=1 Tax=Paenibacillus sp. D2_2 TaxID=3073092 RepID=UPI002814AEC0|nr:NUDIX domain-containing protein [Paenibacillus sp. D2_2]WMT43560.1 NUDIX domain-containing protein [Paenibacillus sp. D2_2]
MECREYLTLWGIPGGWMELERPEDGLEREINEETGLKVQITGLARAIYGNRPNRVELIFKGRIIEGTFRPSSEISDICYCSIDNWPDGLPIKQIEIIKEILSDG